jgi:hypothetical protein
MEPAGTSDCMGQVISSWVYDYMSDDHAAEGFAERAELLVEEEGAEMVDDDVAIGDEAFIIEYGVRDTCVQGAEGEGMMVVFRLERLLVHVWLFNNEDPAEVPAEALPVEPETVIELGEIAEEKAIAVLEADPGEALEPMVLRLGDGERIFGSSADDYMRIDGVDVFYGTETEDQRDERTSRYGDATDVYQLAQPFENEGGDQVVYINTFYRFEDEDAASEWLSESEDRLLENDRLDNIEEVELATAYGDETIAFSVTDTQVDSEVARIYARFGDVVVVLSVGLPDAPNWDAAEVLMEQQAECIDDGFCTGAVPFPGQ